MKRWFVVQTRAGQERAVSRAIEGAAFDIFLPTFQREISIGRRREIVIRPLFPLYFFSFFDQEDSDWGRILRTPNVQTILGLNSGRPHATERRAFADVEEERYPIPIPVPDYVITRLKQLTLLGGGHIMIKEDRPPPLPRLIPDQKVRVIEGPFDGLEGLVDQDHKHRVWVLLDILGKQRRTLIPREALEPLSLVQSAG
jgi:transcription antitermination factor NusG